jgi:hypothetical protein
VSSRECIYIYMYVCVCVYIYICIFYMRWRWRVSPKVSMENLGGNIRSLGGTLHLLRLLSGFMVCLGFSYKVDSPRFAT